MALLVVKDLGQRSHIYGFASVGMRSPGGSGRLVLSFISLCEGSVDRIPSLSELEDEWFERRVANTVSMVERAVSSWTEEGGLPETKYDSTCATQGDTISATWMSATFLRPPSKSNGRARKLSVKVVEDFRLEGCSENEAWGKSTVGLGLGIYVLISWVSFNMVGYVA